MPTPFARALPVLRGIDELSSFGGEASFQALWDWLASRGEIWGDEELAVAMDTLQHDGYVDGTSHDSGWITVGLDSRGRQVVGGWPADGALDPSTLVAAITAALDAAADDPNVPEEQRGMLRRVGEGALTTAVTTAVATAFAAVGGSG